MIEAQSVTAGNPEINDSRRISSLMGLYESGEVIDPVEAELDPETIMAMQHVIQGFNETSPSIPPTELSAHRYGRHCAYSAMMAVLTKWLEEIEAAEKPENGSG